MMPTWYIVASILCGLVLAWLTHDRSQSKPIKFKEPQHTINWTAYHLFDKLFYAKYESGKLTINEYCSLINMAIARRTAHIAKNRKWYQFRCNWEDRVFINKCHRIKKLIDPQKPTEDYEPGGMMHIDSIEKLKSVLKIELQ